MPTKDLHAKLTFFVIQVYNRLQKLFLCLSHKQTISVIEELEKKFDNSVKEWRSVQLYSGINLF